MLNFNELAELSKLSDKKLYVHWSIDGLHEMIIEKMLI